jgi:hypothetical protein
MVAIANVVSLDVVFIITITIQSCNYYCHGVMAAM